MLQRARIAAGKVFVSALAICICLASVAVAQTSSLAVGSPSGVRVGQTVWITTVDGREVQGRIASVSGTEIGLQTDQNIVPIRWTEVRLIEAGFTCQRNRQGRNRRWPGRSDPGRALRKIRMLLESP